VYIGSIALQFISTTTSTKKNKETQNISINYPTPSYFSKKIDGYTL